MPSRTCNVRSLAAVAGAYTRAARSLSPATRRSVLSKLLAAKKAAGRGRCAQMHKHTQAALSVMESRVGALLGRSRRRRRR